MKKLLLLFGLLTSLGSMTHMQAQDEEVFRVAEEMPEFPGCEEQERGLARLRCNRVKLTNYIQANLVYPAQAKAEGVEGSVVVSFIVDKDGSLSDIKVLRDIGAGCSEAALGVLHKMEADGIRWNPGRQDGDPVRVLFHLPIAFQLPKDAVEEERIEEEVVMVDQAIEEYIAEENPSPAMLQRAQSRVSEAPPQIESELEEEPIRPRAVREAVPPPPPPPPAAPQVTSDIFRVVEQMPRFLDNSCETMTSEAERKSCAQTKMLDYVYSQLEYPALAKQHSVEGTVVVAFVVETDGRITEARLMRDIGAGCGQEALRIVNSMNENGPSWLPGKQRGRVVRVQYNLPVKFRIEE